MIVHAMFDVQQSGESEVSETATIGGVNVSHVYLLPLSEGEFPGGEVDVWRGLTKSYLTVVLRSGGRQEILLSRMPLPAVCDIADILAGFEAVTIPVGNIRLRGSDSLAVRLDLEVGASSEIPGRSLQVGVLDTGGVVEQIVGYESVVGETSVAAKAPRRIYAHRLTKGTNAVAPNADVTFELRFGGQHGSLSWAQARMVTDLVRRGEVPHDITRRTVVVYDDRNAAVGSDVSLRVIRGVEDEPIAIFIEKEVRLARQNAAEIAEDARKRVEQVREARGSEAAARLALHPAIMPAIVGERIPLRPEDTVPEPAVPDEVKTGTSVPVAVPVSQAPAGTMLNSAMLTPQDMLKAMPVLRRI